MALGSFFVSGSMFVLLRIAQNLSKYVKLNNKRCHYKNKLLFQTALSIFFQDVAIPAGPNGIAAPHFGQVYVCFILGYFQLWIVQILTFTLQLMTPCNTPATPPNFPDALAAFSRMSTTSGTGGSPGGVTPSPLAAATPHHSNCANVPSDGRQRNGPNPCTQFPATVSYKWVISPNWPIVELRNMWMTRFFPLLLKWLFVIVGGQSAYAEINNRGVMICQTNLVSHYYTFVSAIIFSWKIFYSIEFFSFSPKR